MNRPFEVPARIHTAGKDLLLGHGAYSLTLHMLDDSAVSVTAIADVLAMMLFKAEAARIGRSVDAFPIHRMTADSIDL